MWGLSGKASQLASTPASCSKQAAQLSPRAGGGWALVISDDGVALWWVVHENGVPCTTPPENEVKRRISGVGST